MDSAYRLQIITQLGVKFDDLAEAVQAPGVEGYFGVWPGHAPMVAELREGLVTVRDRHGLVVEYTCTGGVIEVSRGGVVILADHIEERPVGAL